MIVVASFLKIPKQESTKLPWMEKLWGLDPLGSLCLVPSVVCLVLALQWGGSTYAVSLRLWLLSIRILTASSGIVLALSYY